MNVLMQGKLFLSQKKFPLHPFKKNLCKGNIKKERSQARFLSSAY